MEEIAGSAAPDLPEREFTRFPELTRILGQLAPADRDTLTAAPRQLIQAAGEGYGAVRHGPVPL